MESVLIKFASFVLAVGILVAVHEFGHFWVARKLGIKVLRFSVGFGRPLFRRTSARDGTEYVIAAVPLGGYVKMLDEREGPVPPGEQARAFNRQSLAVRSAVVVAGPAFNFLFAIFAFWLVLVAGEEGIRPLVGQVEPDSIAAQAGFKAGDEIRAISGHDTPTWSAVFYRLAAGAVGDKPLAFELQHASGDRTTGWMAAEQIGDLAERDDLLGDLGIEPFRPKVPAIIGEVIPGEPADAAGLRAGDRIVRADGQTVSDWGYWVDFVRSRPGQLIRVEVERGAASIQLDLVPAARDQRSGDPIGRIGAINQTDGDLVAKYRVTYRLGPLEAVPVATLKTLEFSVLTLRVIGNILTGKASVRNLSGPLTIADTAGKTASLSWVQFVKFLAVVSISLGVLNLLPIPVLDGGHLLFFGIEALKGSPLSNEFLMRGQQIGFAILLGLMGIAFYVDLTRFLT